MPSWVELNTGLNQNVHYIAIHPATRHLSVMGHILLAATDGGVFMKDSGSLQWIYFTLPDPSNAEFGDAPAATIDELTFHWVDFDRLNLNVMYALGVKASVNRQWIYKSTDIGQTWTSRGVVIA